MRRWEAQYSAGIRAVACTGKDAKQNLALIGAADGSVHLLDLDALGRGEVKSASRPMATRHRKAVNCAAFSPDGHLCATGSDDFDISYWNTADGQLLYNHKGAHRARVTSLHFASEGRLVSAGGDNHLLV